MKRKAGTFLVVVSLMAVFIPFKIFGYVMPYVVLGVVMIYCPFKVIYQRFFLIVFFVLSYVFIWGVFSIDFVFFNGLVSLLTWSGFIAALIVPRDFFYDVELNRVWRWVAPLTLVELLAGYSQALFGYSQTGGFDGSAGDYVEGTIHLPFESSLSFSNPMFAVGLLILISYAVVHFHAYKSQTSKATLTFLVLLLLLCSVTHITFMATLSFLVAYILVNRKKLINIKFVAVLCILVLFFMVLSFVMPRNFNGILLALSDGSFFYSYKMIAWQQTFSELDFFLGFGPGQLASKSAFISSGLMHDGEISIFNESNMSVSFRSVMEPLWSFMNMDFRTPGSSQTPFSSWLGLVSEFGMLTFIPFYLVLREGALALRYSDGEIKGYQFSVIGLSLTVILIGYQDLYWESPQIMFAFLITVKFMLSKIHKCNVSY